MSEIDMMNTMEKMLNELLVARKTARSSTDYSQEAVDKVDSQFITMVEDIVTFGVDPEEDLVAVQESLQALYVKNINMLEGASIKEKWATAPPPWSNLYTFAHTELDEYHTIILRVVASCANIPAAEILQAICCQFCHTALY